MDGKDKNNQRKKRELYKAPDGGLNDGLGIDHTVCRLSLVKDQNVQIKDGQGQDQL